LIDVSKIGVAVAAPRRRADRDENRLRAGDRSEVVGEREPVLPHVVHHELGKARLVDRHFPGFQRRDSAGIFVDAADLMSEIGAGWLLQISFSKPAA
jgi:hypothetical protein